MKEYIEILEINKKELEHYKDLLEVDFEEDNKEYLEKIGAMKDDEITIGVIRFKNGKYLSIELASGTSNYYDNIVLWEEKDKYLSEVYCLECSFEISDIEFEYDNEKYIVKIEEVDE